MPSTAPHPPLPDPSLIKPGDKALILRAVAYLGASLICLVPCFWQTRIQASDLSSHLYNAWLANLISQNQLAGLHLVRLWDNIEFDVVLATLLPILGLNWTTRLVVGAAVLLV